MRDKAWQKAPIPDAGKVYCVQCQRINVERVCGVCKRCVKCGCGCVVCLICSKKHTQRAWCKVCGQSKIHKKCICRGKPLVWISPLSSSQKHFNPLERYLGLEVEVADPKEAKNHSWPMWLNSTWIRDGSLSAGGLELVVPPQKGDRFIETVVELGKVFAEAGSTVDERCGLHVHVGAMDFGPYELRRLLTVYNMIQFDLFKGLVSSSRAGNRYCRFYKFDQAWLKNLWILTHPRDIQREMLFWLYPESRRIDKDYLGRKVKKLGIANVVQTKRNKYQECRYYGLNFHTWMQRGTVEWRQSEGTVDVERLMFWPLFCGWVTEICSALTDKEALGIKTLKDIVDGKWVRPYKVIEMPQNIREWVHEKHKEGSN